MFRNHSGKYSCLVASLVNSRGATGSPAKITVVTPASFSWAMALAAVSWSVAGSRAYGMFSATSTPGLLEGVDRVLRVRRPTAGSSVSMWR